ncbi:MAG: ribonuclease E/G, partial [Actinomycetes bacterium]
FVGSGGNLEQTVTRNNMEAAEEIVRQLRLRDLGGIIVIDFIDMVLESNRDLVLRRLTECLGRDRTKHQVAEVTSLGLVQMTRKRVGQGLHEAFSETCEHCNGRGFHIRSEPVEAKASGGNGSDGGKGRGRGRGGKGEGPSSTPKPTPLSLPKPEPVAALTDGYRTEADPVAAEAAVAAEQPAEPEVAGEHVAEPEPSVPAAAAVAVVTPVATPVSELTADEQAQLAEAEAPATAPRARRRRRATG